MSKERNLSRLNIRQLTRLLRDTNVSGIEKLVTPKRLRHEVPASKKALITSYEGRQTVESIISGESKRMLLFVGPCSVHDYGGAMEYADKLAELARDPKVTDVFAVVMRAYIEKPRTIDGWKGIVFDPFLNGEENINKGLELSRRLFRDILERGLYTTTEILGGISVNYYDELLCCGSIGARSVENQPSREVASGLSFPMGLKNATNGDVIVAIDALAASKIKHSFVGVADDGHVSQVKTLGNKNLYVILRGGNGEPNYKQHKVDEAVTKLKSRGMPYNLVIDCSHGNTEVVIPDSGGKRKKDYTMQPEVFLDVVRQRADGNLAIVGAMLESYLEEGAQPIPKVLTKDWKSGAKINPRQSVTDACISFEQTSETISRAAEILRRR